MAFDRIEDAVNDIQNGKMVIVVDDEGRENEGDFIIAAEKVTPEDVNFMTKYGRGLICVPLTKERVEQLELPQMVEKNTDDMKTAFTISIDHRNTTTGISAHERALTIRALTDTFVTAEDFNRPGHVFPLRAQEGGVLKRAGHTEAAIDLCRLAGLYPAAVICEIMNDDGSMARVPQLEVIAKKFGLRIVTVADLIRYRMRHDRLVRRAAETELPTKYGVFRAIAYSSLIDGGEHVALVKGDIADKGLHTFTYSFLPHIGQLAEAEVCLRAHELNVPYRVYTSNWHQMITKLPERMQLLKVSGGQVFLQAVKMAEKDNSLILRFSELVGMRSQVELTLPMKAKKICETNMIEKDIKNIEQNLNTIALDFKPFEIKTIRLVF